MITFFVALALLILGYFTYGKLVERVFGPDERPTPAGCANCLSGGNIICVDLWGDLYPAGVQAYDIKKQSYPEKVRGCWLGMVYQYFFNFAIKFIPKLDIEL